MGEESKYTSLSDLVRIFEKKASDINSREMSSSIIHADTYAGAIFYLYISDKAEPENKNTIHNRDSKARGFITGIKNYLKSANNDLEHTNIMQKIRDISSKKPQALAYGIESKKNPYVKGIIRVTYETLSIGRELKDIGEAIKSFDVTPHMLKQKEYWNTYYELEKLLKNDKRNNKKE